MRVAVDIGGTFTDLVAIDENGFRVAKALTTPRSLASGVMEALEQVDPRDVTYLAHGTTIVINALLERRGAVTALFVTRGFRDVLEIQRGNRPDLYNMQYAKPRPFVPRWLRFEIEERLDAQGEVVRPLDEESVQTAINEARAAGATAIAICLLHSYANSAHEQRVAEIVDAVWPGAVRTCSSDLTSEWREYHRMSTAVLDAYVKPTAARYLEDLGEDLSRAGIDRDVQFAMQSSGGIVRFNSAARRPISLVESGPIGGIIGAALVGEWVGASQLITLDIGGTTAKSSLIEGGRVRITGDYHIARTPGFAGYPIRVPVVDVIEIGAGGGSVAWIDEAGGINVGPRSAGADPGPACYGLGGEEPTVTDANLLLGCINPDYFLGGRLQLDTAAARAALMKIATEVGTTTEEAALGIVRIANANMVNLLKLVSVRRGHDPRDFTIVAAGGGGPLHACALARELGISEVIVPPNPGVFSAWGMLMSDLRYDIVQTYVSVLSRFETDHQNDLWNTLNARLRERCDEDGVVPSDDLKLLRSLDLRYVGQEHTVTVEVLGAEDIDVIKGRFRAAHDQLYQFGLDVDVEVVSLRLTGIGSTLKPQPPRLEARQNSASPLKGSRLVTFDGIGRMPTSVADRLALNTDETLHGPLVIEESAATTVVPPDFSVTADAFGNLRLSRVTEDQTNE